MTETQRFFRALVVAAGMLAVATPAFGQQPLPPNLRPFPAYDLALVPDFLGGTQLRFSALTWNAGTGLLEVRAGEVVGPDERNVYQRLYWDDDTYEDLLAGTFVFHPEHGHFHMENYAEYLLAAEDVPGGSTRTGRKTSFCLLDTDKINKSLPGAPKRAQFTTCDAAIQGISVGWGDEYHSGLPGQSIDVTGLPTGNYLLTIVTDPDNQLVETDETDNSASIRIFLDMENMTVDGLPGGGSPDPGDAVSIGQVFPATMFAGDTISVTIDGAGFTDGMSVALSGGSGPAPRVSTVVVQDENTITAVFKAKSGGPPRTRVWDLHVGDGVLTNGFTVFP